MIYTVTFNPSLDYVVDVKTFKTGQVNRTEQEKMFPGGKGINVSIVLNHLGLKSTAWGFLAGFTGEEISKRLDEEGVNTDFIQVELGGVERLFRLAGQIELGTVEIVVEVIGGIFEPLRQAGCRLVDLT